MNEQNISKDTVRTQDSPSYQGVSNIHTEGPGVPGVPVTPVALVGQVPRAPSQLTRPSQRRTSSTARFAPDSIITSVVGLVLLVFGLIAIVRGGFKHSLELPVVHVLAFTHTTRLGLIEILFGLCLLGAGTTGSRHATQFFGGALGVAAFVGAVQTKTFNKSLALESGFAWLVVVVCAVVVLASLLAPRYVTSSTTTHQT